MADWGGIVIRAELARALVALLALAAWAIVLGAAAMSEYPEPVPCECDSDGNCERRCP